MTTNELTSPEAVEKLAAQYDDVGLRDDELVTATLRALSSENKRLREAALKAFTVVEWAVEEGYLLECPHEDADDLLLEMEDVLGVENSDEARDALLAAGWTRK